jgi:cbb3-type cytochrome oxidase maturation protein
VNGLLILIPIALLLGGSGVAAFFWALRSNQFEDPEGAAERILLDDDLDAQDKDGKLDR